MKIPNLIRKSVRFALPACLVAGCLYDKDDPCGDGLVQYKDELLCVCPEGSVFTPEGCVECGAHEVAGATGCVCEDGYLRLSANGPCEEVPVGLGAECDPSANACVAPYDHCEPADGTGYCTSECSGPDDCESGYGCNADSICQKAPSGLNKPCSSDADCAGGEASYCDVFVTMSCLVPGCTVDPDNCFAGTECCDLSAFGIPGLSTLCIEEGECMQ